MSRYSELLSYSVAGKTCNMYNNNFAGNSYPEYATYREIDGLVKKHCNAVLEKQQQAVQEIKDMINDLMRK